MIEVDTNHFKGNHPEQCSLDAIDAPEGARITELVAASPAAVPALAGWYPLLNETKLAAHHRHFFTAEGGGRRATHVRLNIFPDGGVSRLRLWGRLA